MMNEYIVVVINTLVIIMVSFFIYARFGTAKRSSIPVKKEILLRARMDEGCITLLVILAMITLWMIDRYYSSYGMNINFNYLLDGGIFIYVALASFCVYHVTSGDTLTTAGIARMDPFKNVLELISWQQIVNYYWEENCLIIYYQLEDKVDTLLWKNVYPMDKGTVETIFKSYCKIK